MRKHAEMFRVDKGYKLSIVVFYIYIYIYIYIKINISSI